jgi:hypothetical protein
VLKAFAAAALAIALAPVQEATRGVSLPDLTVPSSRLPAGCALVEKAATAETAGKTRIVSIGLPVATNPWIGTDRQALSLIRERLVGPATVPDVPDGPPLNRRDLARYQLQLADGIAEGYAAVYQQSGAAWLTVVQALRFETDDGARMAWPVRRVADPHTVRLAAGRIRGIVSGSGPCFQAVNAYLGSLTR